MAITKEQLELTYRDVELSLYNFALRWVYDPMVAEELVHDAFIRIWNKRESVRQESIKSLLYKTTQNLAINELRRKNLREALPFLNWFDNKDNLRSNLESSLIDKEELKKIKESLENLPIKYKEVLLMSEYSDMSYGEIAQSLDIAEGTVASRKSRALVLLRSGIVKEGGL